MPTIHLNTLDDVLVARIVKKLNSVLSGARFYRSCRRVRDLVELAKPAWPLPCSCLKYTKTSAMLSIHGRNLHFWGPDSRSKLPLEFCRIEDIYVTVVIPELETVGAVEVLNLWCDNSSEPLSEDQLQSLMAAAKPQTVLVWPNVYDVTSSAFKNVKTLYCYVDKMFDGGVSVFNTKEIFKLMVNRKTITLNCANFDKDAITAFLLNWLKGKSTDSLEKLIYESTMSSLDDHNMEEVLNNSQIQSVMQSCDQGQHGWILERKAAGQLRIRVRHAKKTEFHFL